MMQGSIFLRFIYFLVATLALFTSPLQANAGVWVAMADDLEPGLHFFVAVNITNRAIDSPSTDHLASCFLTRGEKKNITVLATIPFIYDHVYAYALHPAYLGDGTRSDKMPFALRTVTLPTLRPQSWRYVLDNGGEVNAVKDISPRTNEGYPVEARKRVAGMTPGDIRRHFYSILWEYLPAFDRAGIQEDLNQYLPLLNDIAAFAHSEQAYKNYMALTEHHRNTDEKYDKIRENIIKEELMKVDQLLDEIKAWLGVEQGKRAPMHEWIARFYKADYVYREMMDNSDHKRIKEWLEEKHFGRVKERKLRWTNPKTGVVYTLDLSGPGNVLTVDLNPFFHLTNRRRYMAKCYPYFHRNEKGIWEFGRLK
jgi:hypothetical protein